MQSKSREREGGDHISWSPYSWVLNNLFQPDLRISLQPGPVLLQKERAVVEVLEVTGFG